MAAPGDGEDALDRNAGWDSGSDCLFGLARDRNLRGGPAAPVEDAEDRAEHDEVDEEVDERLCDAVAAEVDAVLEQDEGVARRQVGTDVPPEVREEGDAVRPSVRRLAEEDDDGDGDERPGGAEQPLDDSG